MRLKFKLSALVNILLSIALVVSIAANLTDAVDYDPWLDITDDGYGGIDDIVSTAEHFGASGDATKLCNITNWPRGTDVTVWWNRYLPPSNVTYSSIYESEGFGRLNVLSYSSLANGVTLEVEVQAILWDEAHSLYHAITVYSFSMNSSANGYRRHSTFIVPSETFRFRISTDSVSEGFLFLSFYLTWA